MNAFQQNLIHALILGAVVSFFFWIRPIPSFGIHGIYLPSGITVENTLPGPVQVLLEFPSHYEDLGTIRTQQHISSLAPEYIQQLLIQNVQFVRNLAAQHGANAVVITQSGRSQSLGVLDGLVITAKAIRIET